MVENDPLRTERDLNARIVAELDAVGFEDAAEVGHGGFGVVYRCAQPALDRVVAVKVLTCDLEPEYLQRFLREQRAMGKLSAHPHIVGILFSGVLAAGRPYIVMPFHSRKSLQDTVRRAGPLDWPDAVRIAVKVSGALEAAHRAGVLHRDVKPGNILTSDYGEPELADFGIAHVSGSFVTSAGVITGSPAFTAPEVLAGSPATVAADVYGLGATLFCLITGHAAVERRAGEQVVTQFLRVTARPVPNLREHDIPDALCEVIERAMAEEPGQRYPSAAALGRALGEVQRQHRFAVDQMVLPAEDEAAQRHSEAAADAPLTPTRRGRTPSGPRTPPTAVTKFRPPIPSRPLVVRDRLIELLRGVRRRRLVVVHAPAGFGKSTLTAQWREMLVGQGARVAWLAVDGDDNNAFWLLTHLVEALRRVLPGLAGELGELLEVHGVDAEPYVLTTLINEIHTRGDHVVLVIDDWHRVVDPAATAVLGYLLEHGCHHLQIIVTSRTRTGLPLTAMRVQDDLVEIGADTLRFTLPEARLFFEGAGGLALDPADIAHLTESTEGWVAAMQLASLSLRDCEDPRELIGNISVSNHTIGDFLAENVLDRLEPTLRTFVLRTSVSERLCGELASVLSGASDGAALLAEAEARDLFLSRVDTAPGWLRYHHMFAEFLRQRLARDHPGWVPDLHRAASRWFADHELLGEAVDHALAAGDEARAVALVEDGGTQLLELSQIAKLRALIAKLSPGAVRSSPRLQITLAWVELLLQRRTSARSTLNHARSLLSEERADSGALRAEADVVEAAIRVAGDRVDGVNDLLSACLAQPEDLHPWVVTAAADMATFVAVYHFDFAEAHRRQRWAGAYHRRMRGPFSVMYGHCFDGVAARARLEIAEAENSLRTALRIARQGEGGHTHGSRIAAALLGDLLFERGDLDAAERLVDESHLLGGEGDVVDSMIATYGTGARIKALRGDLDTARQRLDEGWRIAVTLSLPRLAAHLAEDAAIAGIPLPDSDSPSRRAPVDETDGIALITAELAEAAAIRMLLTDPSGVDEACGRARALLEGVAAMPRPLETLRCRLLLVTCLAVAGDRAEAARVLIPVAGRCADQDLVGMLRFADPAVPALLSDVAASPEYAHTFPSAFLDAVFAPLDSGKDAGR